MTSCTDCIHKTVCFKRLMREKLTPKGFELRCDHFKSKADFAEVKHGYNANLKFCEEDEFRCSECGIHIEDWLVCIDEEEHVWRSSTFDRKEPEERW